MSQSHPMSRPCRARSKQTKKPCGRMALPGGYVCGYHGGKAPQVKAKAAERLADLIDPDRALREAAKLAYADLRELYDEQGRLKPVKDWPDSIAAAVSSVETIRGNLDQGDGRLDSVARVRLVDKVKPLEMLFKHMGLLVDKLEHGGEITIKWQE